ncbi:hypothetical protein SDC9_96824 [bioreactor metagenome]|uniref:Uncharacterized protein n=2 Tax=root TaxID=1 RepID=A0A645AA51_9ZZZZ|nr:hypothetical protein [Lutispora sp.]
MMKAKWSDEKIHIATNKAKLKKFKREAAFIDGKNVCPLCFGSDLGVISASKTPDCVDSEIKFTAICKECKIRVYYFKKIEDI